jgi:splicing factor 45
LPSQKAKLKSTFPKSNTSFTNEAVNYAISSNTSRPQPKSTLADWTAAGDDDDINGFYGGGEKRQRGGRKKRKKNREEHMAAQDWDDIYDPSRPNSYDEYKHSDEKIREVREWKDRLYAHRLARKHSSDRNSDDEDQRRPQMSSILSRIRQMSCINYFQINLLRHPTTPSRRRPSKLYLKNLQIFLTIKQAMRLMLVGSS